MNRALFLATTGAALAAAAAARRRACTASLACSPTAAGASCNEVTTMIRRMRGVLATLTVAAALTGCVVYDPAPGYYAAPAYPSYGYGAVVIDRGYYGGHRHHWGGRHHGGHRYYHGGDRHRP